MASRRMPGSAIFIPKIMPIPTTVKELARANEIIAKVVRMSRSSDKDLRKGCEKASRTLNGLIVGLLEDKRDD